MVTETNIIQSASINSAAMPTSANLNEPNGPRRVSDNRRSNKPIMEKRRRARINNCLNELKTLILDAMKKDPARHSKLEKADILEMTVKHLQNMQRQQTAMSAAADPTVINKFRAGFGECASEVGRFPGLDPIVRRRLLQHLATCLNQNKQQDAVSNGSSSASSSPQPVQVHILPSPQSEMHQQSNIILGNGGVQLVPTRLPNGDIAFVLPTGTTTPSTSSNSPLPLLVPIPTRTPSTASAASSSSNYSLAGSPEPMDALRYSPPMQKPLSLVMRKSVMPVVEDKPWRPW
ncbi:PREDICTED: protein hairy-like [Nicrophorus vespilloides]|uniref:Protein hairy-like n=1 Tax=Nicrophorus vespilloides TaxID=110193 RepID=A0ABM1MND9_NICVS|nr:PREDICTED: protein hairy-like [Nicrophorus vespilloides]